MDKVARGEADDPAAAATPAKDTSEKVEEAPVEAAPVDVGEEPPIPDFILNIPNVTAIDLCVPSRSFLLRGKRAAVLTRPLTQGHHQAHRALHRAARAAVPRGALGTRGAQLPVRLSAADALALRVLQQVGGAVLESPLA